ncbi:MAG: TRAP transporter small permease subunit [Alphaproteobacteria bacterium]|nr:TRAP transporter small permease subunit [Alphaproteobacteria bacterium]
MANVDNAGTEPHHIPVHHGTPRFFSTPVLRWLAWSHVFFTFTYLIENYLVVWQSWPGSIAFFRHFGLLGEAAPLESGLALSAICILLYLSCFALSYVMVMRSRDVTLRASSMSVASVTNYIIRSVFWAVLLVGLVDITVSFLRVEGLLEAWFGQQMASDLGRSAYRGAYVHFPLVIAGFVIGAFSRTLGFPWLALLVVIAELTIVIGRFVFSYEQAFQGDLVRFWYAALFLFASAYTLFEDGHVRVDVLYSTFDRPLKGTVNAFGCIVLGMTMCWVVIFFGMADKTSIINTPIANFEVSQSGFGMYVKFWMAGFLAIFAVAMNLQFTSYFLESVADRRSEPGAREVAAIMH